GVPTDGVDVGPAVPVPDVLRTHHAPRGPVHHLAVDFGAVAITGEGAAQVQSLDRCDRGAREVGHAIVRIDGAVRSLAVHHGALQRHPVGDAPLELRADVAPGRGDDARALGRLDNPGAE